VAVTAVLCAFAVGSTKGSSRLNYVPSIAHVGVIGYILAAGLTRARVSNLTSNFGPFGARGVLFFAYIGVRRGEHDGGGPRPRRPRGAGRRRTARSPPCSASCSRTRRSTPTRPSPPFKIDCDFPVQNLRCGIEQGPVSYDLSLSLAHLLERKKK
jgi:hypothetical protein